MEYFGQGHGVAGRFAGLPDQYAQLENAQVAIYSIGFDKTVTFGSGTKEGPAAIIEASRNMELYDIETDSEPFKKGIHTLPIFYPDSSEELLAKGSHQVLELLKQNKWVATLGGEHSISLAPIKAYSELFRFCVLQLDAHADLQNKYEENPYSHACVMARVVELSAVESITSVGIRSLSKEELRLLPKTTPFFCQNIVHSEDWMDMVINTLSEKVYITIDLDVFDSSIMPSTGTPEPGGLDWYQVTALLRKVAENRDIIGVDIVELAPNPQNVAPDYLAAKLLYKIIAYKYFGKIRRMQ